MRPITLFLTTVVSMRGRASLAMSRISQLPGNFFANNDSGAAVGTLVAVINNANKELKATMQKQDEGLDGILL